MRDLGWFCSRLVLALGAAALAAGTEAHSAENLNAAVASITKIDLNRHINFLASDALEGREAGSRGGHAAVAYVADRLKAFGAQPAGEDGSYVQEFGAGYRNVVAVIPGSDPVLKNEYVLIGAHVDHVGYGSRLNSNGPIGRIHNGADDNASGVSGVLEIVEGLSRLTTPLPRSVIVAFWDGEEKGLLGSQHWADHPTLPLDRINLAFNLDMIGRLASDTVTVYGSRTSVGLRQRLVRNNESSGLRFAYDFKNRDDSDHYTFYRKRIPYLMIYTGEHPDYHRPSDDADRINFDGMERITRLLLRTLVESAEAPTCGGFYDRCREETSAVRIKYAPVPPRMGLTWSGKPLADGSLVVMAVDDDTPASKAGLRTGDCITHVGGVSVSECGELKDIIRKSSGEIRLVVKKAGTDAIEPASIRLDGIPLPAGLLTGLDETDPDSIVCTAVALRSEADLLGFRDGDRILRRTTGQTGSLDASSSWVVERSGLLLTLPERQE
ncbi:MAG: M28 family peptidase [Gemmataceae bacterium]|nr:M28 family peptidase [Gemmataceae bacterium]